MGKSLLNVIKDSGIFLIKGVDQGIYGHLQIDAEFLIKSFYYKIKDYLGF
ncbi:hypothetical protein J4411_00740 [Candidatus Pacearchaeota archaeon]|nr:hypothetical protein [Candidatus Pacearchaeota archaeon]